VSHSFGIRDSESSRVIRRDPAAASIGLDSKAQIPDAGTALIHRPKRVVGPRTFFMGYRCAGHVCSQPNELMMDTKRDTVRERVFFIGSVLVAIVLGVTVLALSLQDWFSKSS
jgi:hypothetical protein